MADGRIVWMDGFVVTVQWDGSPREILALAAEGGPLIGMSLLHGLRLTIDVMTGGIVTLEGIEARPDIAAT